MNRLPTNVVIKPKNLRLNSKVAKETMLLMLRDDFFVVARSIKSFDIMKRRG